MVKDNLIKKGLVVAVILLFIGVAFAPSINANVSKDSELVEYTTEVCGLYGRKQTVKLTQEEAEEVEALFESIRERLNATESREEAVEIFNKAIVDLDKYGLLGGLSVKQAQRLILGRYQIPRWTRFFKRLSDRNDRLFNNDENVLCLIAGKTAYTTVENYRLRFWTNILTYILDKEYYDYVDLFYNLLIVHIIFLQACPLAFGGIIGFGLHRHIPYNIYYHIPANGWIQTIGLNGIKRWNGSFWGALPINSIYDHPCQRWYPGVLHFNGINLINPKDSKHFIMGSSLWIKIEYDN